MGRPSLESHRTPESARLRRMLEPVWAAVVPPLIAFGIESAFWTTIPRTLLFNAAVIISSWIGGLKSGVVSTILSTALLWYLMNPARGGAAQYRLILTAGLFLAVGVAISVFHARLKHATHNAEVALEQSQESTLDLMRARSELEAANANLQRATRDLAESKSLLQAVFDYSPNAIVVKNLEGEFLLTNHQFQQAFGLTAEQMRGKTDYDVLPKPDADRHRSIDAAAIAAGGPVTTEETGKLLGTLLHFLETVFPLQDESGNTFGVCWIGTEVSQIKRAERELAQTAADLKEAQRVAHIGSWMWNLKTQRAEWSEELFHIHGLDASRAAPSYSGELQRLLTPESAKVLDAALENAEKNGEPYELELEVVRPDQTHAWLSIRGEPIRDKSGNLVAIRGTSQDITQLKQLQRMKEEWMSVIAHDLRQPIGVIKMSASMLPELHKGKIDAEEDVITERIRSAAKGLARMVDDLLDMSRIEANRLSLERAWVDPRAVVRQSVAALAHVTGDCPVKVVEEPNVSRVFVDLVRFEQIFGNLISNAVKHGDKASEIEVRVAQRDADVEISVTNHGKGIAPDDVPRLFSRFGRSPTGGASAAPGLGLGLYIAKGLVEAHGGRMWVDSVPNETTTFHFTLPARVPAKEAA